MKRFIKLQPNGKIPTEKWLEPENNYTKLQIRKHTGNIGFRTGSGIVVLDVDTHDGNGYETLEELCKIANINYDDVLAGKFTKTVITPSGGLHMYMSVDDDIRLTRNAKGFPNVDMQYQDKYVVAPYSTINGKAYAVVKPDTEMCELPQEWLEIYQEEKTETNTKLEDIEVKLPVEILSDISQVQPDDVRKLFMRRKARLFKSLGFSMMETFEWLQIMNSVSFKTKFSDGELYDFLESLELDFDEKETGTRTLFTDITTPVSMGGRNDAVTSLSGRLIWLGATEELCLFWIRIYNQLSITPRLPDAELVRTVNSVYKTHIRRNS